LIHSITLRDDVTLPGTQKLGRYIGVQHGVTFAQDALGVVITKGEALSSSRGQTSFALTYCQSPNQRNVARA